MGIDIYASWQGQTEAEQEAQITGFSAVAGSVGYLREAYHGEPYATRVLVPEAFDADFDSGAAIAARLLRERLPMTLEVAKERERDVYDEDVADDDPILRSFVDFVELCEMHERASGEPCIIRASY